MLSVGGGELQAIIIVLVLLMAVVVWPGLFLLLTLISDWRTFAPGTGPHAWERALFPDYAVRRMRGPPPLPGRSGEPMRSRDGGGLKILRGIARVVGILLIMLMASIGVGLVVGRPAAAIGTFLILGAGLLFRRMTLQRRGDRG
jgi:hypothetical protein